MIVFDKNTFGSKREIDEANGFLRVEECNISKCQVRPYLGKEIPNWREFGLEPDKIYNVYCPKEELKKAVPTFNNLPLTREHIEVDVDNVPKEKIVGSLGDHASFEYPYLKNNLIIYDKKDIDLVMSGKKKELSCGYRYTPVRQSGEAEGQHYDFVMTDIVGNHVALVKQGRAGRDVMVADSSKGILETIKEKIMAVFDNDLVEDEFKESEHPRAENGQFTNAGGSNKSSDYPFEEVDKVLYPDDKDKWEQNRKNFEKLKAESEKEELEKIEKAKEKIKNLEEKQKEEHKKEEPHQERNTTFGGFYGDIKNMGKNRWIFEARHEKLKEPLFTAHIDGFTKKEAQKEGFKAFQDYIKKDVDGFKKDVKEMLDKAQTTNDKDLSEPEQEKVGVVMKEFKDGELKSGSGEKVTDPKQAIAIALSEAKKAKDEILEFKEKKVMKEDDVDELAQDAWGEETEYNGQLGHYLTTKSGHHIFIPNGTTTKEAISKHFDELQNQKRQELGANPWRDKNSYEEAKRGLERIKSNMGSLISKDVSSDLDRMISELESKRAISEAKMKEYDDKVREIYEECQKAMKEAEIESSEGKPESKIKEETEYEDIEFKTPRQREKVEKSGNFESEWQDPQHIDIGVPETDNVSYDILDSTMGQMSDGMWENSTAVERYWKNADISKKNGTIGIVVNTSPSWKNSNPYGAMSDEEIRGYFAKKIKAVVKQELEDYSKGDWSRDNEAELQYLSRSNRKPVRVKDAYKLYDHLLGRNKK